ncbi:MAG TPA: hypothetical protein DCQ64_24115 [Candidatus Rokubacteria bacterium]|nr:hypothetical protein [Candidatus Rokubacteria bacterium]
MATYTAWPTSDDVDASLADIGVTLRATGAQATALKARVKAAVEAEVGTRTGRQWLADSVDAVRYFDGSGTQEQEVDEMISLTSVTVLGPPTETLETLSNVVLRTDQGLPYTRIIRLRGSIPGLQTDYVFPVGRQNVGVTGKWGYAASIPADLWEAAAGEQAFRAAKRVGWRPTGRIKGRTIGDTRVDYANVEAEVTGLHDQFEAAVARYTRPAGRRLRNLRPRMI